jgi:hypothetical protein
VNVCECVCACENVCAELCTLFQIMTCVFLYYNSHMHFDVRI